MSCCLSSQVKSATKEREKKISFTERRQGREREGRGREGGDGEEGRLTEGVNYLRNVLVVHAFFYLEGLFTVKVVASRVVVDCPTMVVCLVVVVISCLAMAICVGEAVVIGHVL